jgi:hypothetical protein
MRDAVSVTKQLPGWFGQPKSAQRWKAVGLICLPAGVFGGAVGAFAAGASLIGALGFGLPIGIVPLAICFAKSRSAAR